MPQIPQLAVATKWRSATSDGVERPTEPDDDRVVGPGEDVRVAEVDALDLAVADEPLGAEEADGELGLGAGRPHRHGDRDGRLTRSGRPDLERFLAGERVGALVDGRAPNRARADRCGRPDGDRSGPGDDWLIGPGTRAGAHRPEAVGHAHRLLVSAGIEERPAAEMDNN